MSLSDDLRAAIRQSGLPMNQIAKTVGMSRNVLSRFMAGRSMALETADKLAAYFQLKLEGPAPPAKTSKAPPAFVPPKRKPKKKPKPRRPRPERRRWR